jgi:hypothetical protein
MNEVANRGEPIGLDVPEALSIILLTQMAAIALGGATRLVGLHHHLHAI